MVLRALPDGEPPGSQLRAAKSKTRLPALPLGEGLAGRVGGVGWGWGIWHPAMTSYLVPIPSIVRSGGATDGQRCLLVSLLDDLKPSDCKSNLVNSNLWIKIT